MSWWWLSEGTLHYPRGRCIIGIIMQFSPSRLGGRHSEGRRAAGSGGAIKTGTWYRRRAKSLILGNRSAKSLFPLCSGGRPLISHFGFVLVVAGGRCMGRFGSAQLRGATLDPVSKLTEGRGRSCPGEMWPWRGGGQTSSDAESSATDVCVPPEYLTAQDPPGRLRRTGEGGHSLYG
jgi:hypothetical protein